MRRCKNLLEKRKEFVMSYINNNQEKQMKTVVNELSERLLLTTRTIYNIINTKN